MSSGWFDCTEPSHTLMTKLCSILLGSPSVVYEKYEIECQELPRENIDIVGGMIIEEEVKIDITLGVHIESDDSHALLEA